MRRLLATSLLVCLCVLPACEASGAASGFDEYDADDAAGNRGTIATLDDVTNGLADAEGGSAAPAPAKSPVFTILPGRDATKADTKVGAARESGASGVGVAPAQTERLLIYRGEIRVEVARAEDAARDFLAKVKEWGGYLATQQGTTLTVRLPAAKFDDAFAAVRAAGRVLGESREANDVTEEFVDLGLRIETARKSRERLLEILQKAEKVEDILKVEAEIRRLTEEIERMEGRRKFLADQVAMATLRASFQAVAEAPPVKRSRQKSRFDWVNRTGAESMMERF